MHLIVVQSQAEFTLVGAQVVLHKIRILGGGENGQDCHTPVTQPQPLQPLEPSCVPTPGPAPYLVNVDGFQSQLPQALSAVPVALGG